MRFPSATIRCRLAPLAAFVLASAPPRLPAQGVGEIRVDVPKIAYSRVTLSNGLVAILHEDHSSPIVAINLAYHVGSKDEPVGKRGLAHLFEHAMYGGSAQVAPQEHAQIIEGAGGSINAETREDRTVFHETGPSNLLETMLWLEADRMASLPVRLDSARLELQRSEIMNEFGRDFDATPTVGRFPWGGLQALYGALFPEPNPYSVTALGVASELKNSNLADVRAFFAKYYIPNNATLVIVGDFATADAKRMIQKYFGAIPRGAPVTHPIMAARPLSGESRVVLEDRVAPSRQLWMGWRGSSALNPDRVALQALAGVLGDGASSRLWRSLVTGRKLALSLPLSGSFDFEETGIFQLSVNPAANASLTDIESVADSVIADVRANGVSQAELRLWVSRFAVQALVTRQADTDIAELLEDGEMMYHDPLMELNDIERARRLTPADLQRVAQQYLGSGRVVMSIVPAGRFDLISKPALPYTNVTPWAKRP
jgi:zinc protease